MATTANFALTPNVGRTRISGIGSANTARNGSGAEGTTIYLAFTAGANGARVDRFIASAAGTLAVTTAGMIRVFISSAGGTDKRFWREWQVTAVTPSASAIGWTNYTTSKIDGGLSLNAGEQIWVTSHFSDAAGNQFDIIVEGGDF